MLFLGVMYCFLRPQLNDWTLSSEEAWMTELWMCYCRQHLLCFALFLACCTYCSSAIYEPWRQSSFVRRMVGRHPCNVCLRPKRALHRQRTTHGTPCVQSKLLRTRGRVALVMSWNIFLIVCALFTPLVKFFFLHCTYTQCLPSALSCVSTDLV